MSSAVIKKYDELIRCTNVLSDGIENEFIKFISHQEKCRKKWLAAEEENHETKKYMAKYKADHDTLEVKLKMARHQLDNEMRKRLRAEQSVDQMARQLELIKELLLDKDTNRQSLIQSIYQNEREEPVNPGDSIHESYTIDESSIDLPDSEYDITEDDILDDTGDILGDGRKGKRVPAQPTSTDETSEDADYGKRTRFSTDANSYYI